MNRSILTGVAIVAAFAVAGYGALSYATKSDDQPAPAKPAGVEVADASASTGAADSTPPTEPFAGGTTPSGGFTGDVVEGGDGEKVTIIEYASLTCPHCASFHETIYAPLKSAYIDTDKIRFIFRDYPLDNFAMAASIIARCGGENKYIGYIDLFMSQQDQWRSAENPLDELKDLAKFGGLGAAKINACLKDQDLGQSVLDRARIGQDVFDVQSTPTVILNGKKFEGPMNFEGLKAAIDDLLN